MEHIETVPICSNTLFIYKLNIKNDLSLRFKKEKFKPIEAGTALISKDLNILKKYNDLNKEIKNAVDKTLKEILMLKNVNYRIFSSWLTKTESRAVHGSESHKHSNSWLSGVYYPTYDPHFGIKFYNDSMNHFFTPPDKYNVYNSSDWTVIPKENYLILFFSHLRHKIMPNLSLQDRYSLAFNILPKGEFGHIDSKLIF